MEIIHAMSTNKAFMRLLWATFPVASVAAFLWAVGFLLNAIAGLIP